MRNLSFDGLRGSRLLLVALQGVLQAHSTSTKPSAGVPFDLQDYLASNKQFLTLTNLLAPLKSL